MTIPRVVDFVVREWNAWAPGMSCHEDWREWHDHQAFAQAEKAAIPATVPKTLQRRLSSLARAVFNAAEGCIDSDKTLPIVFSSAHGEVNKSLEMLKSMRKVRKFRRQPLVCQFITPYRDCFP